MNYTYKKGPLKEKDFSSLVKILPEATTKEGEVDIEKLIALAISDEKLIRYFAKDDSKILENFSKDRARSLVRCVADEGGLQAFTWDPSQKKYFEREKLFNSVDEYLDHKLKVALKYAFAVAHHQPEMKIKLGEMIGKLI